MIDTDKFSKSLRAKTIDISMQRIRFSDLRGSLQEQDLSEPPNCSGFGRVRHFRRGTSVGWPENPLPIDPAASKLGLPKGLDMLEAQAFQSASCNWRCWYCFVPFDLLKADPFHSKLMTMGEIVDLYLAEDKRPQVFDLTGGQPELTPEWIPWMMAELTSRGLEKTTFLWSDDNLSSYYFWEHLDDDSINLIRQYENYAKVGCFKGFDPESFSFNTCADSTLFDQQFDIFQRYLSMGIDLYAYATFTARSTKQLDDKMKVFIDRLQAIHENLPLRLVPLEIANYGSVVARQQTVNVEEAIENQYSAIEVWNSELESRFSTEQRAIPINEVLIS